MRILAVTHFLSFKVLHIKGIRKITFYILDISRTKVIGDHTVVTCGMLKGFNHKQIAGLIIELSIISLHLVDYGLVVNSVDHNGNIFVILSR